MTVFTVYNRVILLVLDGAGVGELPDAKEFGDQGANTLGNLALAVGGLQVNCLTQLGLGCITPIKGVAQTRRPLASYGKAAEKAKAKDSMTGHWEIMGCVAEKPPTIFPNGFPSQLIAELCSAAKISGVLGNCAASGTQIIEELGAEHLRAKLPILYTSTDSVLQIAAHLDIFPLTRLYEICKAAREVCDRYAIGRVIARPFRGQPGAFERTYDRKDFPLKPPHKTVLDSLRAAGIPVVSIGKIADLFAGQGIDYAIHTKGNRDGMAALIGMLADFSKGFIFANLVDFDTLYGHRRDPKGFAGALKEFDEDLHFLLEKLQPGDLLCLTADHGNDPTHKASTEHTREYVPILLYDPANSRGKNLGTRKSFADIGATVAKAFGVNTEGKSFGN